MSRRLFLGRVTAAVAGAGALGTVGYGVTAALGDPVIEPVKVTLPGLDSRLSGLRFAVVSDIHLGPLTGRAHTERIVRMINGLEADVVAIVGDLVDGSVDRLGALARPLRDLESRYGAYFVTGNHEYYTANGPGEWIEELGELGVRSLRNERVEIRHQGGRARPGRGQRPRRRRRGRRRPTSPRRSAGATRAARRCCWPTSRCRRRRPPVTAWTCSCPATRTAVRWRRSTWSCRCSSRWCRGWRTVDGVQVYVTRGAGFWGPPVRVGAPPEITLLELRADFPQSAVARSVSNGVVSKRILRRCDDGLLCPRRRRGGAPTSRSGRGSGGLLLKRARHAAQHATRRSWPG